MAFLKFIIYLLIYLIIKLGDFVYFLLVTILKLPLLILRIIFYPIKLVQKNNKPKIHLIKNKKIKANEPIGLLNNDPFINFGKFIRDIYTLLSKVFLLILISGRLLLREIINVVIFIFQLITFPFKFLSNLIRWKSKKSKNKIRKKGKTSTSTSYKIKYIGLGIIFSTFLFFIPIIFILFTESLPKLSDLSLRNIPKSTKILDRNGELLYEIYGVQNRTIVPIEKIPAKLKEATIAIEDKDFYKHSGFDIRAMARAFYVNLNNGKKQGGSTITQQLIKSALLTPEPSIIRKLKEVVLAFMAERKYSKDEILELYFNFIPYGGTAWGIEAASETYFGKDVSQLTLAESAYLAGLPQAPGEYNPFAGDSNKGKNRQKEVLDAMVLEKYISREERDKALSQKLEFKPNSISIKAPHFVMYVKDLLVKKFGLYEVEMGGLQVRTSLDLTKQKEVENIVFSEVEKSRYLGVGNGSSLVINPKNGDIIAMVGSKDYFDTEYDGNVNLTLARRQPGSSIKIIPYTLALINGFTEATILDDTPLTITDPYGPPYTPVNYDGKFHGKIPLRIAFANSFNIPAVRVAQKLGVKEIVDFGNKMGILSWKDSRNYGVSIALGAGEVTMLELVTSYGVIANGGEKVEIDPILEVKNTEDKIIYEKKVKSEQIVDKGISFIISDILADNRARSIAFGSNTPLVIPNQKVSVKTGTTDNKRDNWTVGFTPDIVVATWVGNNDNTPLSQALASGITGAAPMWNQIMLKMLDSKPNQDVLIPSNLIQIKCYGYTAYFIKGTELNQCKGSYGMSITPSLLPTPIINGNNEDRRIRNRFSPFQN